jgi:DNA-directed RNA polymerase specialized sigma24 family protein
MARKLNKVDIDGKPYTRPAAIEQSIDEALTQDQDTLIRRARIRDPAHADYLPSECLLHLVREARLTGDKRRVDRLLPFLFTRCEALLKAAIRDGSRPDAEGLREQVLGAFSELLAKVGTDRDTAELDFYEIRFNQAFAALRRKTLAKDDRRRALFEDIGQMTDEDGEPLDDENVLAHLSEAARTLPAQEGFVHLTQMIEAINGLPAEEREAVFLVCVKGYKVESNDEDEVTAAMLCKVSGRTIRSRLQKAAQKLQKFKEEK